MPLLPQKASFRGKRPGVAAPGPGKGKKCMYISLPGFRRDSPVRREAALEKPRSLMTWIL
jgi:hypothetical protein